jgi:hypothetical protein
MPSLKRSTGSIAELPALPTKALAYFPANLGSLPYSSHKHLTETNQNKVI